MLQTNATSSRKLDNTDRANAEFLLEAFNFAKNDNEIEMCQVSDIRLIVINFGQLYSVLRQQMMKQ